MSSSEHILMGDPRNTGYDLLMHGYLMKTGTRHEALRAAYIPEAYYTDLIDVVGYPNKLNSPLLEATEQGRMGVAMPAHDSLHYLPKEGVFVALCGYVMDQGLQPATLVSPDVEGSILRRISPRYTKVPYFDYQRSRNFTDYNAKSSTPTLGRRAGVDTIPQFPANNLKQLLGSLLQHDLVVKPDRGTSGEGVSFLGRKDILRAVRDVVRGHYEGFVAERRILPPAIHIDDGDHDWNIRAVLNNGQFIHAYARHAPMGSVVNVGKGAERMSLAKLATYPGFDEVDIEPVIQEASTAIGPFIPRGRALLDFIYSNEWRVHLMEAGTGYIFPTLGDTSTFDDPKAIHDRLVNSYLDHVDQERHIELRQAGRINVEEELDWSDSIAMLTKRTQFDYSAENMLVARGAATGDTDIQLLADRLESNFERLQSDVKNGMFIGVYPLENQHNDILAVCEKILSVTEISNELLGASQQLRRRIAVYMSGLLGSDR